MADLGFAQVRRGILEHLASGRLSAIEFSAYVTMILLADHRTGKWIGSAETLAHYLKIHRRGVQRTLESLEQKKYITRHRTPGRHGNYPITIERYFRRTPVSPKAVSRDASVTEKAASVTQASGVLEVLQETQLQEKSRADHRRAVHTPEVVRQIEAKQNRLAKEESVRREARVGAPPATGVSVRPGYHEFKALRAAGRIPPTMEFGDWLVQRGFDRHCDSPRFSSGGAA